MPIGIRIIYTNFRSCIYTCVRHKHAYTYISKPHACMQTYMHATHVNAYMCTRTQIQSQGAVCVCVHIVVFTAVCKRERPTVCVQVLTHKRVFSFTHMYLLIYVGTCARILVFDSLPKFRQLREDSRKLGGRHKGIHPWFNWKQQLPWGVF